MKRLPLLFLVIVVAAFIFGLVHLFNLRFESGDNYPPYSSLRADPLGSKALYESLDHLMPARRHLQPLSKLGEGRDTTLVWLGEEAKELRFLPGEFKDLETFVRTGGRVVIGLLPVLEKPRINRFAARSARGKGSPPRPANAPPGPASTNAPGWQPGDEFADSRKISVRARWNVSFVSRLRKLVVPTLCVITASVLGTSISTSSVAFGMRPRSQFAGLFQSPPAGFVQRIVYGPTVK